MRCGSEESSEAVQRFQHHVLHVRIRPLWATTSTPWRRLLLRHGHRAALEARLIAKHPIVNLANAVLEGIKVLEFHEAVAQITSLVPATRDIDIAK